MYTEQEITFLDEQELCSHLQTGGSLSRLEKHYEERPGQVELMSWIIHGFNEDRIITAEAGTGVGKSFAYLIPALKWADLNNQRVVISTATINLQQQIMEKDLPMAQQLNGTEHIKAVLVKGRRNYLCWSRLEEALNENILFLEKNDTLIQIREWAQHSKDGSVSDLSFMPPPDQWNRIASEADSCFGSRCPHFEKCFVMKARKKASAAGILVVNHHLFFADLSLRTKGTGFEAPAILPPYDKVIFDEAHNIENSATSYFSEEYNRLALFRLLQRLYSQNKNHTRGVLVKLEEIQSPPEGPLFQEMLRELVSQAEILDALAFDYIPSEQSIRITKIQEQDYIKRIQEPLKGLQRKLQVFLAWLKKWKDSIEEKDKETRPVLEFRMILGRLNQMDSFLSRYLSLETEDPSVFWLEKKVLKGKSHVRFIISPLTIASWMNRRVYDNISTLIFTSATLSQGGSFQYWHQRMGLDQMSRERMKSGCVPSPFPYNSRVLLALPDDIPMPDTLHYRQALISQIRQLLEMSEGKALVLFTSCELLKFCYDNLSSHWMMPEIRLLKQGDGDRARLLEDFNRDKNSVLFGTDSFWEGVDAPGDTLKLVILCRLPFKVPSEPVYKARLEAIEQRGGNPFRELSLPEAVIKFRQGFGRLMRRSTDRGAVVVLDSRLLYKNYGTLFLRSLPETLISRKRFTSVLEDLEDFFY